MKPSVIDRALAGAAIRVPGLGRFRPSPGFGAMLGAWALCLFVFVAVENIDRMAIALWSTAKNRSLLVDLLLAFPAGLIADIATALVLGAPFLAGLALFANFWRRPWGIRLAQVALLFFLFALAFIEGAEFVFWGEFDSRFNGVAVNYLIFPREVIGNLQQSFRLDLAVPAAGVVALFGFLTLRRRYVAALRAPLMPGDRSKGVALALVLGGLGGAYLAIAPTSLSADRQINEIAGNGIHSFLRAALTNDDQYEGLYLELPRAERHRRVREMVRQDNVQFVAPVDDEPLLREVVNPPRTRKLNVVMVFEESFGSVYVDGLDNTTAESISPNLTRLARDGLFFDNIYATGNRTVRALEAVLTSFPPIPGISTTRRAGSVGMYSLPAHLREAGYRTAFLYGGRPIFDNMGAFWEGIGFEAVWGQSDIAKAEFTTAWGVADEYLFGEALRRLDQMTVGDTPAFLSLLTVSNHRPYTYPAGRVDKDPLKKRRQNAATYADWAFGDFIAKARAKPWFDDTVFVFFGDHGPRVYGAAEVPVPSYRIPVLFYAPKHIAPARVTEMGSNMDIGPTLLGLLGLSYRSPFFGVDLTRPRPAGSRVAMDHNFSIGYSDGREVAILMPGRRSRGYAMSLGPAPLGQPHETNPEALANAVALTQTAHEMFYSGRYRSR